MISSRRVAGILLAAYVLVAGLIVFAPTADVPNAAVRLLSELVIDLGAPPWISLEAVEFVTNVLLFVPLSLLGSTFRPRWGWRAWLLAGFAASLTIELAQLVLLPDRSAAAADLVANTLGALVGYLMVAWRHRSRWVDG